MKPELFRCLTQGYRKSYIVSDILSGLVVAIIALPLSIALGIQSNATLQAGLITAIVAGFCISAFGGTRFQIGGPTAAFLVLLYGYFSDPEIGVLGVGIATMAAGVLLVILGLCRVGKFIQYIPYPLFISYGTGIGVTLMIGQVKDFLGLAVGGAADTIGKLQLIFTSLHTINFWSVGIGLFTVLVIILLPRILKKIPSAFVAVVAATLVTLAIEHLTGGSSRIATIGSLYGDVQAEFRFIDFGAIGSVKVWKLIVPMLLFAFLSGMEALLSATVADGITDIKHDSNQELVGQGIANIASPIFGGLPATGVIARTAANIDAGAKSPLSGVFHALFLLLMYVALMPVMKFIPMTALAAVLIVVSFRMCKFSVFFKLTALTVRDGIILIGSCLLTVLMDLSYGILGGFALALLVNIGAMKDRLKIVAVDVESLTNAQKFKSERRGALKLSGSIYFLNINRLLKRIASGCADCDEFILDMSDVRRVDMTSVERLAKRAKAMARDGRRLVLHNAQARVAERYQKSFLHIVRTW